MPFFGPATLGGGDITQGGRYNDIIATLMQQFPGLERLSAGVQSPPSSLQQLGYTSPGINLYSGQGANIYGGLGLFEGSSAGQPESVTAGLATGALGKSSTQTPIANTGQTQPAQVYTSPTLMPLGNASALGGGGQPSQPDQGGAGNTTSFNAADLLSGGQRIADLAGRLFGSEPTFPEAGSPGFQAYRAGERQDYSQANMNLPSQNQPLPTGLTQSEVGLPPAPSGVSAPAPSFTQQPSTMSLDQLLGNEAVLRSAIGPGPNEGPIGPSMQDIFGGISGTAGDLASTVTGAAGATSGILGPMGAEAAIGATPALGGVIPAEIAGMTGSELGAAVASGAVAPSVLQGLGAATGLSTGLLVSMILGPLSGMVIGAALNPFAQSQNKLLNRQKELRSLQKDLGTALPIMQNGLQLPTKYEQASRSGDPAQLRQVALEAQQVIGQGPVISRASAEGSMPPWFDEANANAANVYMQAMTQLQAMGALNKTQQPEQPYYEPFVGWSGTYTPPPQYDVGGIGIPSGLIPPGTLQGFPVPGINPQLLQQYSQALFPGR